MKDGTGLRKKALRINVEKMKYLASERQNVQGLGRDSISIGSSKVDVCYLRNKQQLKMGPPQQSQI